MSGAQNQAPPWIVFAGRYLLLVSSSLRTFQARPSSRCFTVKSASGPIAPTTTISALPSSASVGP
jgi:hypothetical protein